MIASGNRVLVGADGAVVEVTSYRAFLAASSTVSLPNLPYMR